MFQKLIKEYKDFQPDDSKVDWNLYKERLPAEMIQFLQENGTGSYDKGYLWTVDPGEYVPILKYWNLDPADDIIIARTGMGHLFSLNQGSVYALDCHYGKFEQVTGSADIFFDYFLCDTKYLDEVYFRKLYHQAVTKMPVPSSRQCFHFVPALALGGTPQVEALTVTDIDICHSILSQLFV